MPFEPVANASVDVCCVALTAAVKVIVNVLAVAQVGPPRVVGAGVMVAETPGAAPAKSTQTGPVKPLSGVTVISVEAVPPGGTTSESGEADKV